MKHILITGTTSGIGRALLEHYVSLGMNVTSVNRRRLPEMEEKFSGVDFKVIDVCHGQGIGELIRELSVSGKLPDLFILNAGINEVDNNAYFDVDTYKDVIETNLYGVMNFVAPLTRVGRITKKVRIIAISSMGAYIANPYCLSYHVSKRALSASFQVLSKMYSKTNLKFKQVLLGPVPTEIKDTSNQFPKLMSWIKSIFSASQSGTVKAIARFSENDRASLIFPWPAWFLFQVMKLAQLCFPGFYRGQKMLEGASRQTLAPKREELSHVKK